MLNAEEAKRLSDSIEQYPITIVDSKSGVTITFDGKEQFRAWLDPFYNPFKDVFNLGGNL